MAELLLPRQPHNNVLTSEPVTIIPGILYGVNGDDPGPGHRDAYATMIVGQDMDLITDVGSGINHDQLVERVNRVREMSNGRKKTGLFVTHEHADHAADAQRCYEEGLVDEIYAGYPIITVTPTGDASIMDAYDENSRMPDVPIHRRFHDGEEIDLGGGVLVEVVSLPGHAPDMTGLFVRDVGIVSDLSGGVSPRIGSDIEMQHRSLEKLMDRAHHKGIQRIIEGHVGVLNPTVTMEEYRAMTRTHGRPRRVAWAHLYNPLD